MSLMNKGLLCYSFKGIRMDTARLTVSMTLTYKFNMPNVVLSMLSDTQNNVDRVGVFWRTKCFLQLICAETGGGCIFTALRYM